MTDYRDYQPKTTSRERENIEWSTCNTYNVRDTKTPRILLIGDSICNGYQIKVREILSDKLNITFWVSSKCVTDPDYFRELDFVIGAYRYELISFNNGLHSLGTDRAEWEAAYRAAVRFIRAKLPDAKLVLTLCTPLRTETLTEKSAELNDITKRIAAEENLPMIDLFSPMEALDKSSGMTDNFHWHDPAKDIQARIIADYAVNVLMPEGGISQTSTETGPDGAME